MTKKIVVVGTLDTKEMEIRFVKDLIAGKGHVPVIIDCGILKEPSLVPDVSRHEIARVAGTTIEAILATGDKNHAIGTMTRGTVQVTRDLYAAEG